MAGVITGREGDLGGDVRRLPALRPQSIAAGVDEDPVEPRLETGRVAQGLPLAPGLDERVVGRVLRLGRVAQDGPRQSVRLVEVFVGQPDERRVASASRRRTRADGRSANSMTSDDRFTMT